VIKTHELQNRSALLHNETQRDKSIFNQFIDPYNYKGNVNFQSIVEWVLLNGREREENKKSCCAFLNTGDVNVMHIHQTEPLSVCNVRFCMGRLSACIYDN
jgi:hypothetical protein